MLRNTMEYHIQIAGFKSNINDFRELIQNINEIKKETSQNQNCTVQLLNAQGIAGELHVRHAAIHAIKAFGRNENIAGDLGLEICVRASGGRQISKALQILGLKEGEMDVCAVAMGCNGFILQRLEPLLQKRDDEVLNPDENVLRKLYGISDAEEETAGSVVRALMERTSLLILHG
jgi:KEOPS complex subunit Cgi121